MRKLILIGSVQGSLINFRGDLIRLLVKSNYQLTAMASESHSSVTRKLADLGVDYISYAVKRNSLNPIADIKTLLVLKRHFYSIKPRIILAYTIKPIVWGGLASYFLPNSRFYALITGLGFAFQRGSFKRNMLCKLVVVLYRIALKRAERVIFQNPDNLKDFVRLGIVVDEKCVLVNGSGVNLDHYTYTHVPTSNKCFLAIGRLLGEKGFREYVKAAVLVKKKYPEYSFKLIGPEDPSPDGISINEVESWSDQGLIEYLGSKSDVRPYLKKCTVFVLPSYHEGMPRTVLEAMATGRPILTTDVPGCRETVIDGENGFLVPKADAEALAERMIWFIENQDQLQRMGDRSRELAEEKYDVHKVNAQLMEIMGL